MYFGVAGMFFLCFDLFRMGMRWLRFTVAPAIFGGWKESMKIRAELARRRLLDGRGLADTPSDELTDGNVEAHRELTS